MNFFRDRKMIFGIAVLLTAVITLVVALALMSDGSEGETAVIYAASVDIARGEQFTEENIVPVTVPVAEAEGYELDQTKIIGKVATSHVWMGDRISAGKLADQLADMSPDEGFNYISMAIPSLDAGVAGFISAGDFISVMCYGEREVPVEEPEEVEGEEPVDGEVVEPVEDEYYDEYEDEDEYEEEVEPEYEIVSFIPHGLEAIEIVDLRDGTNISTAEALGEDVPSTVTLVVTTEQALILYQAMNEYNIHFIRVGGENITPSYEILAQEALEAELEAELENAEVVPAA